jgi:cytochrome c peroxidase
MQSSRALIASVFLAFAATPVAAQFIETATPPPPSAKELDLPTVIETISGLSVVDEGTADGANGFIKDEAAAVLLGKAFFWDMQVGSDGVACGTCHYHAGADARETNQLSPGLKGGNGVFDATATGTGGPNYTLNANDFPFHQLATPTDRDSAVLFDTDDVESSQGTFSATFDDVEPGDENDECTVVSPDPFGFHVNSINVRRVEPRNTPTVVNAAFNHRNFWDGRANNIFNGVDLFGQRNTAARILENQGSGVAQIQVAFENASLASQSVGPPASDFEMACSGRNFLKIGKKMVSLEALAEQEVHSNDSVLGGLSNSPADGLDGPGNDGILYTELIASAISDRFWDSDKLFDADKNEIGSGAPSNTDEYTQMEANFSLIWGLSIQAYLRTLISDDAPYDQWAEDPGNDRSTDEGNGRGILSAQQMRGMNLFFTNELGDGLNKTGERGNCSTCHQGPFFSTATFPFTEEEESGEFPEQEQLVERMRRGDGVHIAEGLFRYFISGSGSVGGYSLSGTAGARNIPARYPAASGGDLSVNGSSTCSVYSYMQNEDTIFIPNPGGPFPPFIEVPNTASRDAVIVLRNCVPGQWLQITLIDGGPGADSATILPIAPIVLPPPQDPPLPIVPLGPPVVGLIVGDFTLEIPTLYDTAFYNIGVRPSDEDPGIAADDPFGNPLSFTQQWIDELLGTPVADAEAFESLQLARVHNPFSWFGDGVLFPGGFAGPEWPVIGFFPCNPPIFGAPPAGIFGACTLGTENGKGHGAYPKYPTGQGPGVDFLQLQAINSMPTAMDGAFKVSNLRNLTLTAPFFHNGGQLTLKQVVEFYNRGGDFAIENLGDLAPNIHPLSLDDGQMDDLVAFLEALTDERVTCEEAPFDHPEIRIANGADGNTTSVKEAKKKAKKGQSVDNLEKIEPTGAGGRLADGLPCIDQENFLL